MDDSQNPAAIWLDFLLTSSLCRLRYWTNFHHGLGLQRPLESYASLHVRGVSKLFKAKSTSLIRSVPEERIDQLKAEYIRHRDERQVEALANYKKERIEAMKRHAGIKDGPI